MFGGQGSGGGFNFAPAAASTSGSTPGTGFSFGASSAAASTAPGVGGFSFGSAPTSSAPSAGGFSFGSTASSSASTAPGFSFGAAATTTVAPTTGTSSSGAGFSFGATTGSGFSGFSGFGGAPTATSAPAPTAVNTATATTGFNFGLAATKATNALASTTSAPAVSGFSLGGGTGMPTGFGANINASAASTVAAIAPTGISFGGTATKTTAAATPLLGGLLATPASQTAAPTATTTTAATGFSLNAPGVSSSSGFSFSSALGQPAAATSASTLGSGGLGSLSGLNTSTASTSIATTSTTATTSTLTGGQKQMTFRQLEDVVSKWSTELEEQEKSFLEQATQVNAWDRIVMENGEKIIQLNKDLERVKLDQQKLDHELDFVHSQQRELEELLVPLETALEEMPPISHTQHAHLEREHTYTLAESLDSQLKRMSQDLKEIVERLNSTNVTPDDNDPLQQITKILNAHVVSLLWVDRNSGNLQRRAEEIAKMMDLEKKEQERNFRMAYS